MSRNRGNWRETTPHRAVWADSAPSVVPAAIRLWAIQNIVVSVVVGFGTSALVLIAFVG